VLAVLARSRLATAGRCSPGAFCRSAFTSGTDRSGPPGALHAPAPGQGSRRAQPAPEGSAGPLWQGATRRGWWRRRRSLERSSGSTRFRSGAGPWPSPAPIPLGSQGAVWEVEGVFVDLGTGLQVYGEEAGSRTVGVFAAGSCGRPAMRP